MSNNNSDHYFLRGGGEMGELIRAKDWSKTALGDPADWPDSLRTMVAVMLDNPFGMYIAWGSEHIQLYNDGYRPILGATKHPQALGISTRETFSEIWHIIGPMFDGVMKGKAVGFPDFMLPLNRSGFVEECYFDFSYSPIRNNDGEVGGVLVTVIETTNKKKADERLKESNERFRNTMKQSPVGITILRGSEYIVEMANDAYLQLVDKKEADFVGKPLFASLPEVEASVHSLLDNVLNTGIPYHGNEAPIPVNRYGKQEVGYFDFLYHPLKEENGKISGVIVSATEVTEMVEARKTIEERKRLYETITQNTPDFIYVFDLSYRFTYANEALLKMWGRTWDEAIGKGMLEVGYEPWQAEKHEREIDEVIATKKPVRGEVSFPHATLGKRMYDYIFAPVINEKGEVEAVTGTTRDILDIKNAEESLKKSKEQFSTLADNMENLAWLADGEGRIYWYNKKWYEYTGTTPEQMETWGWNTVSDPKQVPEMLEKQQNSINTGEPFEMVVSLKGADHIFRPFLTRVLPLRDDEGKIIRWIGTNTDISVQKEAEEHFRQMAERMPQKVWTADEQGNRNYFNQIMLDYTGLTFDELKDWGWGKIVHPDDWPKTKQKWEHSINTGEDFENKNRLRRKDGNYLWHLIRATAVKDDQGRPKMWIGSKTEIQEQIELSETLGENLRESDKRMQAILQHAPDAVISIDEDGIIRSWNVESETIFGWKENEVIGKTLTETIIPQRYRKQHNEGMKHFLNTGEGPVINKPIELAALKKNGSEFPIELKISTSKINNRYIFIGFIRDISIRKNAAEIIQNKTNQLMEAQQLARIGSWEWDVRTNKIEWSDELYRIFGLTPQEFKADYENYLKYIHPDDREYVNSIVQQALKDHQPYNFFHKAACSDGEVRILSATGKVITDSAGDVIRISGTAQDVTEQKKKEEELKISEERFYKIFDSNPVPMSLTEIKDNKIKYANNLFYNAFGYTEEEVIGRSSEELNLLDPEEYKRVIDLIFGYLHENRSIAEVQALSKEETETLLVKLKQAENMKDFEIVYTRKNGELFPALVSFEIIRIGTESYTVTSYQDITERKKAETLLKNQNDQLEKMNKELESFAYISSHDLQEPLRKIQTFATRILEKEENNLSDNGKDMFNRMQNSAKRMQTLIHDLLAYSRTNTTERKFETTALNKIIEEVKEDFDEELKGKNATIEANDLCDVAIIPFQFRQLMHNLIGNALKFSNPHYAPHIQIKSKIANGITLHNQRLSPQNKYCHITVSDNGIGFEQQYSEKIFDVFQRLHGRNEYDGTGIGLAIVKKIVDNHNGIITATGELNKGATFDIYIPST
ncbi:PAS domain S-box protein [Spirosoma spitsbergense]|uniref:PAS domain S-box protein n=1 Tax=Spirosoma spitsbergense TaxID=431554 RepID=UPI000382E9A9|nr:PAS domain S-box protein [Spirosoma spitsbergense]